MTAEEYFIKGTAPVLSCTCHIKKTLCADSGMQKSIFCPEDTAIEKVYLLFGTEGTADYAYVMPESVDTACNVHTSFWDDLFGDDTQQNPDEDHAQDNGDNTGDGGWFDDLWGGLFE